MRVEHGFGPVWDAGSRVLVLGVRMKRSVYTES